jgi:AAA+ ATPase superfamily predicted ATPase
LPFLFTKLGRWWHKDKEIDLVALNEEIDCKEIGRERKLEGARIPLL